MLQWNGQLKLLECSANKCKLRARLSSRFGLFKNEKQTKNFLKIMITEKAARCVNLSFSVYIVSKNIHQWSLSH